MRVLIVSYDVPPTTSARSFRVATVTRQLQRQGHEVTVFGADRGGTDQGLVAKLGPARVIRTPAGPLDRARSRPHAPGATTMPPRWRRHLQHLAIPERQFEWALWLAYYRPTLEKPDLVLSFCPLFSGVLVAHRLARRFGVPHVIDYGDPWSWHPNPHRPAWREAIDVALERRVLARAAGVIVNTEPQRAGMVERFPIARIACLPNGYDPDDYATNVPVAADELRHLGGLYAVRVSLDPFAAAIRATRAFRVISYGQREATALPEGFEERATVPFHESLRLMQGAGALLVVGNHGGLQIPSKVYHYLGSGRPVLAVVDRERDPIAQIDAPEQLVCATNDVASLTAALGKMRMLVDRTFQPPEALSWRSIGARYGAFLTTCA